jgi:hypothetical protein
MRDAEKELRRLERTRDRLSEELGAIDPADHEAMAEVGRQLAEATAQVDAVEERWLELGAELEA